MCHSKVQVSCIYYLIQCSQNHMKQILSLPTENETEAQTSHDSMATQLLTAVRALVQSLHSTTSLRS